jgi:DNA repair exonuclease SbcCD ATPase subunit
LDAIEVELNQIQNDKTQTELSRKIADCEEDISKEQRNLGDVGMIKGEIESLEQEQKELKTKQSTIDEKISKCHSSSKVKMEIEMMRNDKKNKQDQIRRNKKPIEEEFEKFFEQSENQNVENLFSIFFQPNI